MKLFVATALCALLCLPLTAGALTDISEAKTACMVNRGTDLKTMDDIREKLQQWGRWKIVSHPEDADLLLIISSLIRKLQQDPSAPPADPQPDTATTQLEAPRQLARRLLFQKCFSPSLIGSPETSLPSSAPFADVTSSVGFRPISSAA